MIWCVQVELSWYEGQEKVDLTDYVNSGTWDIIGCPGINEKPSGNESDSGEFRVSQITFILRIRRKVSLQLHRLCHWTPAFKTNFYK